MSLCHMCPRECGINRNEPTLGFCRAPNEYLISRAAKHMWEEPPISGTNGSGTIFFGGCNLGCVYCQNRAISRGQKGQLMNEQELESKIWELCELGVHNINFVTPTHYTLPLVKLLERIKTRLPIPVVWNTGGYESTDTLRALDGLVDIYLPDFKYHSSALAKKYSHAEDYPEIAQKAIAEMYRQRGAVRFREDGMMQSGIVVRHLVLPSHRADSIEVIRTLSNLVPVRDIRLSLMSQYTPDFVDKDAYPELKRRVTSFEYQSVLSEAESLGFEGYFQGRSSATSSYTPDF